MNEREMDCAELTFTNGLPLFEFFIMWLLALDVMGSSSVSRLDLGVGGGRRSGSVWTEGRCRTGRPLGSNFGWRSNDGAE